MHPPGVRARTAAPAPSATTRPSPITTRAVPWATTRSPRPRAADAAADGAGQVADRRAAHRSEEGPEPRSLSVLLSPGHANANSPAGRDRHERRARSAGLNPTVQCVFDDDVPLGLTNAAGHPEIELICRRDEELIPVIVELGRHRVPHERSQQRSAERSVSTQ